MPSIFKVHATHIHDQSKSKRVLDSFHLPGKTLQKPNGAIPASLSKFDPDIQAIE